MVPFCKKHRSAVMVAGTDILLDPLRDPYVRARSRPWIATLCLIGLLVLAAGIRMVYAYALDARDEEIIRIAYVNGVSDTLNMDLETLEELKADRKKCRIIVGAVADRYIAKVTALTYQTDVRSGKIQEEPMRPAAAKRGRTIRVPKNYRSW